MTDASFESGTRAATRQELQEAQRKYRLVMQRAAPNLRPDAHRNCLQLATSADLDALSRASIANIAELQIDRCSDVVPLAQLVDFPALTILRLGGLDRITDLEWLPHLPRLRTMRLEGFGADFASLTGISAAPALEALVLDALRARATVESVAPLAALTELRLLALPALSCLDPSLGALAGLQKLELFHGTAHFGPSEYEQLALRIPRLRCAWFSNLAWQLL